MTESYLVIAATSEHIQAVAFDLDGILYDSAPDLATAVQAMREYLGLPVLPTQMTESYVGDGIGKSVHRVVTRSHEKEADPRIWEKGFVFLMKYYREYLSDLTHPYSETEAGLGLLKSLDVPLVVITNKNEVLAVELLEQLNPDGYLSLVLSGDSLTKKESNPLPLQHAAEALGIDVANMLVVGDSRNDILTAKAAGCFSIGVTFGYGDIALFPQGKTAKPDLLTRALSEIYENLQPQKNKDEG